MWRRDRTVLGSRHLGLAMIADGAQFPLPLPRAFGPLGVCLAGLFEYRGLG